MKKRLAIKRAALGTCSRSRRRDFGVVVGVEERLSVWLVPIPASLVSGIYLRTAFPMGVADDASAGDVTMGV